MSLVCGGLPSNGCKLEVDANTFSNRPSALLHMRLEPGWWSETPTREHITTWNRHSMLTHVVWTLDSIAVVMEVTHILDLLTSFGWPQTERLTQSGQHNITFVYLITS